MISPPPVYSWGGAAVDVPARRAPCNLGARHAAVGKRAGARSSPKDSREGSLPDPCNAAQGGPAEGARFVVSKGHKPQYAAFRFSLMFPRHHRDHTRDSRLLPGEQPGWTIHMRARKKQAFSNPGL